MFRTAVSQLLRNVSAILQNYYSLLYPLIIHIATPQYSIWFTSQREEKIFQYQKCNSKKQNYGIKTCSKLLVHKLKISLFFVLKGILNYRKLKNSIYYSQPRHIHDLWHIQNHRIFKRSTVFKSLLVISFGYSSML